MISGYIQTISRGLYLSTLAGEHERFKRALRDPGKEQVKVLEGILRKNRHVEYLSKFSLDLENTLESFTRNVPVSSYNDYRPLLEKLRTGEGSPLTADGPLCLHPTSGSEAERKLIPFTDDLAEQFRKAIAPWLFSQAGRRPGLLSGSHYWSISPSFSQGECDEAEGFLDDAEYLGSVGRVAHGYSQAVPGDVTQARSGREFLNRTCAYLACRDDLVFISVWSPTFLTSLARHLRENVDRVLGEIELLPRRFRRRGSFAISSALRKAADGDFGELWPRLEVISCWTHGAGEPYARELGEMFEGVEIEPKGLMATEAFVSLFFELDFDPVLATRSHFFEFEDVVTGEVQMANQVESGRCYSVIVTTGGGLYRYRLGDVVEVTGYLAATPTLRFLGKERLVSDHTGEKLSAVHVGSVLKRAFKDREWADFRMLAPTKINGQLSYALFVGGKGKPSLDHSVMSALEEGLMDNFHYGVSRRSGQLGPLGLYWVDERERSAALTYCESVAGEGKRLGDVKLQPLHTTLGLEQRLKGEFIGRHGGGEVS